MAMACSFPRWGWRHLLVSALVLVAAHRGNAADPQRLNHLQVLHAHNSYHTCPLPNMQALFASAAGQMVAQKLPADESPSMWFYGKPSLLSLVRDYGVRALEIDMVYDPTGGRYQFRAGPKLAASIGGANSTGLDGGAALATPGWKVMHIPDLDFQTSCNTVTECLGPIAKWSAANPGHTPLFISFELRSWNPFKLLGPADLGLVQNLLGAGGPHNNLTTSPTPDKSHMLALQAELLKVFKRQQLFTPDDFRGKYASLQARITADGWPEYRQVKGKTLLRLISADYTGVARSLWPGSQGSLFFLEDTYYGGGVLMTTEDVVFIQIDWSIVWGNQNPAVANISYTAPAAQWQTPAVADAYRAEVANIVGMNKYMVRAFTDSPVVQAKANFKAFASAAAAGGAHLLHTDYPNGWKSSCVFTSDYTVPLQQVWSGTWQAGSATSRSTTSWKGKASRKKLASSCNPVTALKACRTYAAGKKQPPAYCACYKQV